MTVADLAPADEYFGPLKQSVVGIRNTIRDLGLRYDVNHDIGPQTLASAQLTENAIKDWQRKYPRDDQLPRALYYLQRLYTKILTGPARDKAKSTATWIFVSYASSPQAKQLHKIIASEVLPPLPSAEPTLDASTPSQSPAPAGASSFAPGTGATTNAGPGFVTAAPYPAGAGAPPPTGGASADPELPGLLSAPLVPPNEVASPAPSASALPAPSASSSAAPAPSASSSVAPAPSPSASPSVPPRR